ncbi:hypothetical protein Hokovirus_3_207 [Hokovirus HKV1]|uniref:Band 7 domain-containing protein n=1 Tax=Hokovirus HKV1 TaxID=1977638 RepID=A0A1V0SH18_9VIRU|nr:hypothetical protein Hokovirus_3_207 [Hokovirus HKV1]
MINEHVGKEILNYGYEINNVLVTDIQLPTEIANAINKVNASQKNKAAINDSEANFILDMLKKLRLKERKHYKVKVCPYKD